MELFKILPLLIHFIILLKFGYDIVSLRAGILSKNEMTDIKDMYYIFLCVLMLSIFMSLLLKERRLKVLSLLTGIIAFAAVWSGDKTFTPEFHTAPLYMPVDDADDEGEEETNE